MKLCSYQFVSSVCFCPFLSWHQSIEFFVVVVVVFFCTKHPLTQAQLSPDFSGRASPDMAWPTFRSWLPEYPYSTMNRSSSLKLYEVRVFCWGSSSLRRRNKLSFGGEEDEEEEAEGHLSLAGLLKSEDSGPAACSVTTAASSSGLE